MIIPQFVNREKCLQIGRKVQVNIARASKMGTVFGGRDYEMSRDACKFLHADQQLLQLASYLLGRSAQLVRTIVFDKTKQANWGVPWHQDRTIRVKERVNVTGYFNWTRKSDRIHVEPPVSILENMVTLRLSLDDCGPKNGPLIVLPKSHTSGRLNQTMLASMVANKRPVIASTKTGDIVAMKPLSAHSSRPAKQPSHRRIVHLEYASCPLHGNLSWAMS